MAMIDKQRYQQIRALFDEVIDLPFDAREARLHATGADQSLIQEVMSLIVVDETNFRRQVSASLAPHLNTPTPKPGDHVGAWRLIREIGHGGMGSVYLVERCDGHFEQTAALKFLTGLPNAERIDYFTRERQTLAKLTHPNIARLYDGGATPDGDPYLVMEYVDGLQIDEHCCKHHLKQDAILALFIAACQGVAFAHRQLIVHCDIKPSNLLINTEGRPVLLDFGISRFSSSAASTTESNASAPNSNTKAYTPHYASPEQRAGGEVSTLTDIYSLGVLLNELLMLASATDDELKAVIAKATLDEPSARYATVDSLVEDLTRYERKEPLAALPVTQAYVAKKFLQRRWPLVLVGAAFAITICGFTVKVITESQRAIRAEQVALSERDRAQSAESLAVNESRAKEVARSEAVQERDRAKQAEASAVNERDAKEKARNEALRERDRAVAAEGTAKQEQQKAKTAEIAARQTSDFLISIFEDSNPNAESGDVPVSKLIAAAEARVEQQMKGQPATQAELYSTLGVVRSNMGRTKEALTNLERAIALERKQDRPLVLAEMLTQHHRIVSTSRGAVATSAYAYEALKLREKFAAPDSRELAESRMSVALNASSAGRKDEAMRLFEQALEVLEKRYPSHASTADAYGVIGGHYRLNGDLPKSLDYYERSVKVSAITYGELHPSYLNHYEWYARVLASLRRFDDAETAFRRAIELRKRLHGPQNMLVATVMMAYADMLNVADRPRDAIAVVNEAMPTIAKVEGAVSMGYGVALNKISASNSLLDNYAEAARAAAEVVAIIKRLGIQGHAEPNTIMNLGVFEMRAGNLDAAYRSLAEADKLFRARFGDMHAFVVTSQLNLAEWYVLARQFDEATKRLDAIEDKLPKGNPISKLGFDRQRALIAAGKGEFDQSIAELERLEAVRFKTLGTTSATAWLRMMDRAEVLAMRGTPTDKMLSAALATRILAKISTTFDPNSPRIVRLKELQRQ
jgi:eukaryotic-like serine/threonine-protein kinase